MTASLSFAQTLSADEFAAVTDRLGIHSLPAALTLPSSHATIDVRDAARAQALADLAARGLVDDGRVDSDLTAVIGAVHRPDRELAVRLVTPADVVRICAVRRGSVCALARSAGERIDLRILGRGVGLTDVIAALIAELPGSSPALVEPVGAPLADMTDSLSDVRDALQFIDRFRALGSSPRAASLMGAALGCRQAFAEVVYAAMIDGEDRISRAPAAVAVFYTSRGRVIGAPSVSPSGQLWTTLKAGSDHAFGQAVRQLVELCDERWGTDSEI